ncbi:MAG: hypothetical protein AAGF26_16520 [Cyanobacteria bacterium P01_G01_bin.49]
MKKLFTATFLASALSLIPNSVKASTIGGSFVFTSSTEFGQIFNGLATFEFDNDTGNGTAFFTLNGEIGAGEQPLTMSNLSEDLLILTFDDGIVEGIVGNGGGVTNEEGMSIGTVDDVVAVKVPEDTSVVSFLAFSVLGFGYISNKRKRHF